MDFFLGYALLFNIAFGFVYLQVCCKAQTKDKGAKARLMLQTIIKQMRTVTVQME